MGMSHMMSNLKGGHRGGKNAYKRHKKRVQRKKEALGIVKSTPEPELLELRTVHDLKRLKKQPRTNLIMSGKKRNKLLKRLKHAKQDAKRKEEAAAKKTASDVTMKDVQSDLPEGATESAEADVEMA